MELPRESTGRSWFNNVMLHTVARFRVVRGSLQSSNVPKVSYSSVASVQPFLTKKRTIPPSCKALSVSRIVFDDRRRARGRLSQTRDKRVRHVLHTGCA